MTYLSQKELSARWNGIIKVSTLRNWRNQGKGPSFIRLGSKAVYPLAEIEKYEADNFIERSAA